MVSYMMEQVNPNVEARDLVGEKDCTVYWLCKTRLQNGALAVLCISHCLCTPFIQIYVYGWAYIGNMYCKLSIESHDSKKQVRKGK